MQKTRKLASPQIRSMEDIPMSLLRQPPASEFLHGSRHGDITAMRGVCLQCLLTSFFPSQSLLTTYGPESVCCTFADCGTCYPDQRFVRADHEYQQSPCAGGGSGVELSKQLEGTADLSCPDAQRRLKELTTAEDRTLLLLRSLRSFYVALGAFALAAFVSLLGAVTASIKLPAIVLPLELAGVAAGLVAVAALVYGSMLLFRETRIAVQVISERAATVRERFGTSQNFRNL